MNALRLGTRGSQLALWQAHAVVDRIRATGRPAPEIVVIKTSGDKLADAPLSQVGGKRLFVKEIEDALLGGTIDLAVHSCKDMPAVLPEGLEISAALPREDPRDVLVLPQAAGAVSSLDELLGRIGPRARVGTSSVRRVAELSRLMPDARFEPIRGNLDTRLRKLDRGDYDLLVLAAAGMRRLGFAGRISLTLPVEACVPAPGQGAVIVETRSGDQAAGSALAPISDPRTAAAIAAERALVAALGGGCQTPIGAVALSVGEDLAMHAVVVSLDGSRVVRGEDRGPAAAAIRLGERVGARLIADGALVILDEVRDRQSPPRGVRP